MNFDFLDDDGAGEGEDEKILHPGPVDPLHFLTLPEVDPTSPGPKSPATQMNESALVPESKPEPYRHPMISPVPLSIDEYKSGMKTMGIYQLELDAAASAANMSLLYYSFRNPRDIRKDFEGVLADHNKIYLALKHLNKGWTAWIQWRKAKALKLRLADLKKKRSKLQNELEISLANQRPTGSLDPQAFVAQCRNARDDFQKEYDAWAKKYAYFLMPSARPEQPLTEDEELEARARAYRQRHKP